MLSKMPVAATAKSVKIMKRICWQITFLLFQGLKTFFGLLRFACKLVGRKHCVPSFLDRHGKKVKKKYVRARVYLEGNRTIFKKK